MPRRLASTNAVSPVLLLATAAMLSVGSIADGAAAAMLCSGGSDQRTLTQLAEAIVATAGAICDDDSGTMPMPVAVIQPPQGLTGDWAEGFLLTPPVTRTSLVRPLRNTLTNLPPPTV